MEDHRPWKRSNLASAIDKLCEANNIANRKFARLFLLGNQYEIDFVYDAETAIKDWPEKGEHYIMGVKGTNVFYDFPNSSPMVISFNNLNYRAIIVPEHLTVKECILKFAEWRTEIKLPENFQVQYADNYIIDQSMTMRECAEQHRMFDKFYFSIDVPNCFEIIGDIIPEPEAFGSRSSAIIKFIDPTSPCYGITTKVSRFIFNVFLELLSSSHQIFQKCQNFLIFCVGILYF
jgi:hypothetical protein